MCHRESNEGKEDGIRAHRSERPAQNAAFSQAHGRHSLELTCGRETRRPARPRQPCTLDSTLDVHITSPARLSLITMDELGVDIRKEVRALSAARNQN